MSKNIPRLVGAKIKFYRKKRGLTLQALADAINKSRATMSKYESGQIIIDIEVLFEIAKILEVPIYCFLDDVKTNKESPNSTNVESGDDLQFYFYTVSDKSSNTIMTSCIDLCPSEGVEYMTLYFDTTPEQKSNAALVYTGTTTNTHDTFSFQCTNIENALDQMYFTSSHRGINVDGILIGFWVGFTFESQSPVCMKAVISNRPLTDTAALLNMLTVTDDEIRYFKRRGRFLLIGEI